MKVVSFHDAYFIRFFNNYCIFFYQGTKAFCSGGDQALRSGDGYADFENFGRLNVLDLQVINFIKKFLLACLVPNSVQSCAS